MSDLLAARSQMAVSLAFHIVFAVVGIAMPVTLILWGWALGQYPYLVPPDLTIGAAAAPPATLELLVGALAVGAVVLLPSLYYLLRVFKGSHQRSAVSRQ